MNNILGVFVYEFRMGIRRKGVWLGYGVVFLLYLFAITSNGRFLETPGMSTKDMWAMTALLGFIYNLFLPVVGGISAADRLIRDRNLHLEELLRSTGLKISDYLVGKYLGTLAAISLPVFLGILILRIYALYQGASPLTIGMSIVTFMVINLACLRFYHCLLPGLSAGDPHTGLSGTFHRILVLGQLPISRDVPNPEWHIAAGFR